MSDWLAPSHRAVEWPCQVRSAGGAERQVHARVCTGVAVDMQRVVVLPGDVNAPRHAHDRGGAERLALVARRLVGRRIPGVGDLAPSGVSGTRV
jgi:hypothetical protein